MEASELVETPPTLTLPATRFARGGRGCTERAARYRTPHRRGKTRRMIRPVLTELVLFVLPFLVYAVYLWATRAGVLQPESWPLSTLMWLTIAALLLIAGSFIVLAQWGGEPAGSAYVPAHIEDGKLVPGTTQ